MRAGLILLMSMFLLFTCNAEPEPLTVAPDDPSREPATVAPVGPERPSHKGKTASSTSDKRPAPYLKTPTLPIPADAKPVRVDLSKGGSLVLPMGTREIKVNDGGERGVTVRDYYLNHPMGRGLKITEYPLGDRACEALIATREAAFEAGYANEDPEFLKLHRFHRGARCKVARAVCYYSDTSRRTRHEIEKGARFHREAAFLLCKDRVAISIAWKVPDGADVTPAVLDALTTIAGSFTTR